MVESIAIMAMMMHGISSFILNPCTWLFKYANDNVRPTKNKLKQEVMYILFLLETF